MDKIRKWLENLRASIIRREEEADVVTMISKITAKLPRVQGEYWRSDRRTDSDDPMSIKRPEPQRKRRVGVHDISAAFKDGSVSDDTEDGGINNNNNEGNSLETSSLTDLSSLSSSKISVHEEIEIACEQFVSAFGRKGRQVGRFEDAKHITCLPGDELLITDLVLGRLQKFTKNANSITIFAPGEMTPIWATAITLNDNIAVTMYKERCIKVLSPQGDCLLTFGSSCLTGPRGIACDIKGQFIVTDEKLGMVLMFDADGTFLRYLGDPERPQERFLKPRYVCININNDILVSDSEKHVVKIFYSDGRFRKSFGSFGKMDGQFKCPYGVCTNSTGEIFVADHYNNRISVFTKDGVFVRHVITCSHGLHHPQGIAINSRNYLFITHGQFKATEILTFKLTAKIHEIDID